MPNGVVAISCLLLIGLSVAMTWSSAALAADGSFQLVRVLATGDVFGLDTRILGAGVHQGAVVLAAAAGASDTFALTVLLGVGQLVVPATAWSLAIVLSRGDAVVCAAVVLTAALSAGSTWFVSVSEIVLAAPLTTLVAVLLWRPEPWGRRHVVLATLACVILVASYESALVTGTALAIWAVWRGAASASTLDRFGTWSVAALSAGSVLVALVGIRAGANPTHSQSLLYYVVSLDPWPFYLGLAAIAALVAGYGTWLQSPARQICVAIGVGGLAVSAMALDPSVATAFKARGGAAIAAFTLIVFLFVSWRTTRTRAVADVRAVARVLVAVPPLVTVVMALSSLLALQGWSDSLEAFRRQVAATRGTVATTSALPPGKRDVLWGWTASSLSLLLRADPDAGVLVDPDPVYVPFPPESAHTQLPARYVWRQR